MYATRKAFKRFTSICPVSYTHLDVYKRQEYVFSGGYDAAERKLLCIYSSEKPEEPFPARCLNIEVLQKDKTLSHRDYLGALLSLGIKRECVGDILVTEDGAQCFVLEKQSGLCLLYTSQGTTITVRDLFYNTPARMKFLKKDASEGNYVSDVVSQLALSHPEISFKFVREGKVQFQTPGDGKLLSAAYAVLSRDFAKDLLEVRHVHGNYQISGLVTPPKSCLLYTSRCV